MARVTAPCSCIQGVLIERKKQTNINDHNGPTPQTGIDIMLHSLKSEALDAQQIHIATKIIVIEPLLFNLRMSKGKLISKQKTWGVARRCGVYVVEMMQPVSSRVKKQCIRSSLIVAPYVSR